MGLAYLLEMDVSSISKHFSLHLLGRPGSWERGIPLTCRASSMIASVFSSRSMIRRAVTTWTGESMTSTLTLVMVSHSCWPNASFIQSRAKC